MIPVLHGGPVSRRAAIWVAGLLIINVGGLFSQGRSRDSDLAFGRGVQLQKQGDLAGARDAYETALKLDPQRIDARSNLGLAYAGLHQYDRAVEAFQGALAIDPKQPAILFNLGLTYLEAGRNENARRTLEELVQAQPANAAARHYLGISLLKLGRVREGIAELEEVVRARSGDLDAACTLASAYIAEKQPAKAQPLVEGPIGHRDSAAAHLVAGSYYMAVQNYRQAVIEFRRVQELNPDLPELARDLGTAYALTGSQETAISLFEARLHKNPSDFEALGFLGWLYLETGRLDEAGRILAKAHALKPADPDVLFQLGRLARQQEQFQKAADLLERVVAAKPRDLQAHVLLAQTYFRLKRKADGAREREIVRRLSAEEPHPAQE